MYARMEHLNVAQLSMHGWIWVIVSTHAVKILSKTWVEVLLGEIIVFCLESR